MLLWAFRSERLLNCLSRFDERRNGSFISLTVGWVLLVWEICGYAYGIMVFWYNSFQSKCVNGFALKFLWLIILGKAYFNKISLNVGSYVFLTENNFRERVSSYCDVCIVRIFILNLHEIFELILHYFIITTEVYLKPSTQTAILKTPQIRFLLFRLC